MLKTKKPPWRFITIFRSRNFFLENYNESDQLLRFSQRMSDFRVLLMKNIHQRDWGRRLGTLSIHDRWSSLHGLVYWIVTVRHEIRECVTTPSRQAHFGSCAMTYNYVTIDIRVLYDNRASQEHGTIWAHQPWSTCTCIFHNSRTAQLSLLSLSLSSVVGKIWPRCPCPNHTTVVRQSYDARLLYDIRTIALKKNYRESKKKQQHKNSFQRKNYFCKFSFSTFNEYDQSCVIFKVEIPYHTYKHDKGAIYLIWYVTLTI